MRLALKIAGWVLLTPVLLVAALLLALNTGPGRRQVESLLNKTLAGTVRITGLSGRLPDRLRVQRLELLDKKGVWLSAEDVAATWSPLALVHKVAHIDDLHADTLRIDRVIESEGGSSGGESGGLPVQIHVDHLAADRVELGAAIPGGPASLSLAGSLNLDTYTTGAADLDLNRLDGDGAYRLTGSLTESQVRLALDVNEPAGGLVSRAASLPDLGALAVHAKLDGPRNASAVDVTVAAGPLRAAAKGTLDLADGAANLSVQANAPAMAPRPDLRWQGIALDAHVQGPFTKPQGRGTFEIDALEAAGAAVKSLHADAGGDAAGIHLKARADGVRVPGPDPDLLADAPVELTVDAKPDQPDGPATFEISHALFTVRGHATTSGTVGGAADVALPDLAPLARAAGTALAGKAALHVTARQEDGTRVEADGTVSLTEAPGPAVALLGPDATLGLSATLSGGDATVTRLAVAGQKLALDAHGALRDGTLDAAAHAALSDLSAAAPTLQGRADLDATAHGTLDDLAATVDAKGDVGTRGFAPAPLTVQARAEHLPNAPEGRITAQGTLDGAPLALDASARRDGDGALQATIERASWRSAAADGAFTLPQGAALPQGKLTLRVGNLADFHALTNLDLAGSISADASLDRETGRLQAKLAGIAVPGAKVNAASIQATVRDPLGKPSVQARLTASGVDASGVTGDARIDANGPQNALALKLDANLQVQGTPTQLAGNATVDVPVKRLQLTAFTASARDQQLRLLAPARITFGDAVAVDRLRLALGDARAELAGKLSPALDATLEARLPGSLGALYDPAYAADGAISLDATVRGTPARPTGRAKLDVTGLHLRAGPGAAAPPLNAAVTADLAGDRARVEGRLRAGSAHLALDGTAPLAPTGALDLHATGNLDLALLNPIVSAAGRQVRGRIALDARAAGTPASPRLSGQVTLANGEIQDFTQGLRLTNLAGTARLAGDAITIPSLTGRAGPGSVSLSGDVGVLRPGFPVDLRVKLQNARPLASDLLTARLNGDVAVSGSVSAGLLVAGTVDVLRADIRVPERLPVSVQSLRVIRPGQHPAPPSSPALALRLDLTVEAARAIFINGRGLDAEMAGKLHVGGSTSSPQVSGGFDLRRGTFSLAGTTLTFTKGRIGFEGEGLADRIDPSLNFEATSIAAQVTATLAITGTASKPKISLTSVPELPQDEILAYLLFKRSVKDLGPLQYASIAAAVADISGVGGGLSNPLDTVRRDLGLDRLSFGSSQAAKKSATSDNQTNTTLQAGRYVANGVYVGATQDVTGQGTGAQVQIDLTKRLKLDTTVGNGQVGNQVGLSYQFEW